jgi:hypothetical protein
MDRAILFNEGVAKAWNEWRVMGRVGGPRDERIKCLASRDDRTCAETAPATGSPSSGTADRLGFHPVALECHSVALRNASRLDPPSSDQTIGTRLTASIGAARRGISVCGTVIDCLMIPGLGSARWVRQSPASSSSLLLSIPSQMPPRCDIDAGFDNDQAVRALKSLANLMYAIILIMLYILSETIR